MNIKIKNDKELEFVIFCIENIAKELGISAQSIYDKVAIESNFLNNYIVANYEILHTQGKEYIVNDIIDTMRERGIEV